MAAKIVSVFPDNRRVGKPSHQGVVVLFDEIDGRPLAVIEGRAVTEIRTAAVSWLAIERLAPRSSLTLAVIGSGRQARAHLSAGLHRREWSRVTVAARHQESIDALASDFPSVRIVTTAEEAVKGAQIVICCTDSRTPVVSRQWLSQDAVLVSVGSGSEVEPTIVSASKVVVEWRGALSSLPPAGAEELQGYDPNAATELGELLDERLDALSGEVGLTLFKSTGLGLEDLAVARLIFDLAQARHVGTSLEWS
jgi:ornithine cyclodeaminase/alanine dehydrogenase-like protein (mu-crystallin family)